MQKAILISTTLGMAFAVATPIYWQYLMRSPSRGSSGSLGFAVFTIVAAAIFTPHFRYLIGGSSMRKSVLARIFGLLASLALCGIGGWFLAFTIYDRYVLSPEFGMLYMYSLLLMGLFSVLQFGLLCEPSDRPPPPLSL